MSLLLFDEITGTKPFLKWAGGKGQLISAIEERLPFNFAKLDEVTYIEPFIGSGAIFFWILRRFPNIKHAIINDINVDLIKAYQTIKNEPETLILVLNSLQRQYYTFSDEASKKCFFLQKREEFNSRTKDDIAQTALLIFLNRTCFNGLYRVNSKNEFNVPFGKYNSPKICDPDTIRADSALLQRVTILNGDYSHTIDFIGDDNTFFYFDPPYKPISKTSSFNSYSKETFNDSEQIRLKNFCELLTSKGCHWLLSNSDPKNNNPDDNFFDDLYERAACHIDRVNAKRNINSDAAKRGEIKELLIYNYEKSFI